MLLFVRFFTFLLIILQFACSQLDSPEQNHDVHADTYPASAQTQVEDSTQLEDIETVIVEGRRPVRPFIEDAENLDIVREDENIIFVADKLEAAVDGEKLQLQMVLDTDGEPKLHWVEGGHKGNPGLG